LENDKFDKTGGTLSGNIEIEGLTNPHIALDGATGGLSRFYLTEGWGGTGSYAGALIQYNGDDNKFSMRTRHYNIANPGPFLEVALGSKDVVFPGDIEVSGDLSVGVVGGAALEVLINGALEITGGQNTGLMVANGGEVVTPTLMVNTIKADAVIGTVIDVTNDISVPNLEVTDGADITGGATITGGADITGNFVSSGTNASITGTSNAGVAGEVVTLTSGTSGNETKLQMTDNLVKIGLTGSPDNLEVIGEVICTTDPSTEDNLTNRKYVDEAVGGKVSKGGDTMTGALDLEADLNIKSGNITISNTSTDVCRITMEEATDDGNLVMEYDGSQTGDLNYFALYSDANNWVGKGGGFNYVPRNGRVGIGLTNPSEKFEVNGNAIIGGNLTASGATSLDSTLTVSGATSLDSTLTVSGATSIDSTLEVKSHAYVDGNATVWGSIYTADAIYNNMLGFGGDAQPSINLLKISGSGGGIVMKATYGENDNVQVTQAPKLDFYTQRLSADTLRMTLSEDGLALTDDLVVGGNANVNGDLTVVDGNLIIEHSDAAEFDPYIVLNSRKTSQVYDGVSSLFLTEQFFDRTHIQGAYVEYDGDNNALKIGTQNAGSSTSSSTRTNAITIVRGSDNVYIDGDVSSAGIYKKANIPLITQVHSFQQQEGDVNQFDDVGFVQHTPNPDNNDTQRIRGIASLCDMLPYSMTIACDSDSQALRTLTFEVRRANSSLTGANLTYANTTLVGEVSISAGQNAANSAIFELEDDVIIPFGYSWGLYKSSTTGINNEVLMKVGFYQV